MTAQNPLDNDPGPEPTLFSAIITPHRSLNSTGFLIVMLLVSGFSFIAGMVFFLLGAWPVVGFLGLDVLLVYWAFRANFRAAAALPPAAWADAPFRALRSPVAMRGSVPGRLQRPDEVQNAGEHEHAHDPREAAQARAVEVVQTLLVGPVLVTDGHAEQAHRQGLHEVVLERVPAGTVGWPQTTHQSMSACVVTPLQRVQIRASVPTNA